VLRLAAWLRERLTPEALSEVLRRVVAIDEVTRGKALTIEDRPPTPCALLVDGACSVYEVRPFVCRACDASEAWLAGEPLFAGCAAKFPDGKRRRLPLASP
jgi:hypothetical protein